MNLYEYNLIPGGEETSYIYHYKRLLFGVSVPALPSWNDILYIHAQEQSKIMSPTRALGYNIGINIAKNHKIPLKVKSIPGAQSLRNSWREVATYPLTQKRVKCLVLLYREASLKDPDKPKVRRDVYNPIIKGIIDGFIDAGLFIDDNERYHKTVTIDYMGVSANPRIEIYFYYVDEE
jgi:Holliday junction resolvase RusA-like endonuclease